MKTCLTFLFAVAAMISRAQGPLIQVVSFGKQQAIGVAVSKTGRIFVSFPQRKPFEYSVAEVSGDSSRPFPNTSWNRGDSMHPDWHFVNVQALWVDEENNLWVLDPANPGTITVTPDLTGKAALANAAKPDPETAVKLVKINLATDKVERIYRFEDIPRDSSALNDIRTDLPHGVAYLSDPKLSCIVVLDLKSGRSRLALQHDRATQAEQHFVLNLDGKEVRDTAGHAFRSNVNGIALAPDSFFYFRPINGTRLYRIHTRYLSDFGLNDTELGTHVELVAETGVCHGMIADTSGNIYFTDSPDKSITYLTPSRELKTLVQDDRLSWPDSFAIGPDGYLYVTASQINRLPKYNNGVDRVDYPFRLYKVKLLAPVR